MILLYTTCQYKKEAEKIGNFLIKKKLAACCNIFPIESIYCWKNKIIKGKEVVLLVKTLKKNSNKARKEIKKLHSYKIPCILEISITEINSDYLKWLIGELG